MRRRRYLGPPGCSPVSLIESLINSLDATGKGQIWPFDPIGDRSAEFTNRGRTGIEIICRLWGWRPGDEILVPSYHCGAELDVFLAMGISVRLYKIDLHLMIDVKEIERRITPETRGVYAIHYFGMPQQLEELSALCRSRGLKLIEDCALALFSCLPDGRSVGTVSDAAIFSFTKTLPVPDGGAVVWRAGAPDLSYPMKPPDAANTCRSCGGLVWRFMLAYLNRIHCERMGVLLAGWRKKNRNPIQFGQLPDSYYYDGSLSRVGISSISRRLVYRADEESIRNVRRENFLKILVGLRAVSEFVVPLYSSLPHGVCPVAFPVTVGRRVEFVSELARRGVEVISWWSGYHVQVDLANFVETKYLKDHVIALPIHQSMSGDDVNWLIESVIDVATKLHVYATMDTKVV